MTMLQMNENLWSIAHDLAYEMHEHNVDVNEVNKVTAFMRQYHQTDDAIDKFRSLLQQLAYSDDAPLQSGSTRDYYEDIQKCCQKHLKEIKHADELMLILGWCKRLMYYYKVEPKRAAEEQRPSQQQQQTPEPPPMQTPQQPKEPEKPKTAVHDRVNATIQKKDWIKVTVQLDTDNKEILIFEHPYYPKQVGDQIKVRVQGVNNEGQVTEILPAN
ncbi:hypothetical protein C6503_14960 [Candidatus Poribacteria bacterium]|nr:MAG: hypothetical protein C6503_14960 [Candidatus Poribacteria bacterium]